MSKQRYDVVVLGGGLVGSTMSLALAQQGFRVALVDAAPVAERADPEFDGRAYAVAPGSRNLLTALGIWNAIDGKAQPVREITIADRCEGPVPPATLHFDPAETGAEALGWIVEDRFLRAALLDAVASSVVDHIAPSKALSVASGAARAEIALHTGQTLLTSLVIACDGRQSTIARGAGIQYLAWEYRQTGLVSAIDHDLPHGGTAHQAFFAGGPFAVLPLAGNRSSLVWSECAAAAQAINSLNDADYTNEIARRIGGRLGAIMLAGRRWEYPLGLSLAMSYAVPRLVVAGDAAHGVHPIAGQGMNMGLRDVAALTEVLVSGGRLGADPGDLAILQGYERWRRFDATAMALGMDGLNRLFSTDLAPLQALRNVGIAGVSALGGARRFFAQTASGQVGDVPRLLAGLAL